MTKSGGGLLEKNDDKSGDREGSASMRERKTLRVTCERRRDRERVGAVDVESVESEENLSTASSDSGELYSLTLNWKILPSKLPALWPYAVRICTS